MDKELRELIGLLVEQGFDVRRTRRGHFFVTKEGAPIATISGTPSDQRSIKNSKAALRRAGFEERRRR